MESQNVDTCVFYLLIFWLDYPASITARRAKPIAAKNSGGRFPRGMLPRLLERGCDLQASRSERSTAKYVGWQFLYHEKYIPDRPSEIVVKSGDVVLLQKL